MSHDPVAEFEKRFAQMLGSEYCIALNSGTSALHAALEAIDVRNQDVIMPALCPGLIAFAVIHAGGRPIFADVDPQTQLITADTIRPLLHPRVKAVIAVALHGLPCDIDPIMHLAAGKNHFFVIEDCAQCLLGRYKDGYAGTRADVGVFSFERKKHITTGSVGGAIITNDQSLSYRARKFGGLGYKHLTASGGSTSLDARAYQNPHYARFDTIGLNYRISHAQAECGLEQLRVAHERVETRRAIGYLWQEALHEQLQPHGYDADNVFYTAAFDPMWSRLMVEKNSWQLLYDEFVRRGGDGFYAAPRLPFEEPALYDYKPLTPTPQAARLQSAIICLKTHYQSLLAAKEQCDILADTLARHEYTRPLYAQG